MKKIFFILSIILILLLFLSILVLSTKGLLPSESSKSTTEPTEQEESLPIEED